MGIETVLHFPTRGRNLLRVQGDLLAAHALDVRNVFVVMGDPTAIGDYPNAMDNYDLVPSGLIKLIKQGFNTGVDHAGTDIGQPTSFFVGCALNFNPANLDEEIKILRRKLRAGADFVLTQPHLRSQPGPDLPRPLPSRARPASQSRSWSESCPWPAPGMPLFWHHEVPGITIPAETREKMVAAGEHGARTGVQIAIELIQSIRSQVQGIYIMPAFNRYDYAAEIIEAVHQG